MISTLHPPHKFAGNPVLMKEQAVETWTVLNGTAWYDDESQLCGMSYFTGRGRIHSVHDAKMQFVNGRVQK